MKKLKTRFFSKWARKDMIKVRKTIKNAIAESVKDLLKGGFHTSFTDKELKELGIKIPDVQISSEKIHKIRMKTRFSQTVFARLLNVSPSSVRQWEQGKRKPTGSTKVLLEILEKEPSILNYRIKGTEHAGKNET